MAMETFKLSFSRLFHFILVLNILGLISTASASQEDASSSIVLERDLESAFRRLIPPAKKDPLHRLMRAIQQGQSSTQEVNQILEAHRLQTLETYFLELRGRIDAKRLGVSRSREELLQIQRSRMMSTEEKNQRSIQLLMEITSQEREARYEKITPNQLAALLAFYKDLDPILNRLIEPKPIFYINTTKARLAAEVTAWPVIELREHGFDLPPIHYGPRESEKWREVARTFWNNNLRFEFLEIWSQLVNQTAGHMRYRHLQGFDSRFLLELRKWALEKDPFQARDLFVAFVSNYSSSQMIAKNGVDLRNWPDKDKKSLAYQIVLLQNIKNRKELFDLFQSGETPKRFPESNSKIWNQALEAFATAQNHPDREKCITVLLESIAKKNSQKKPD